MDARTRKKFRSQEWFDNPDNPGHDGALSRALPQLRPDARRAAVRQAADRHRPDRLRPVALQPPPLELAKRVRAGIEAAGGVPFEFPCHPIQETGKRPTAALDRNLAYLVAGRGALRLSARRRGADHRLRQDHAGAADGGGHRQPSGDRAVGRADAQRLAPRRAHRFRHHRVEGARDACRRRDRLRPVHGPGRLVGAVGRLLQHHGHGDDDEFAGRGARHAACRARPPFRRPTASAARWPTRPASASSRW